MPAYRVKLRRGTTAEHANFIGAEGEVTVDTDKKRLVVHDGVTPGGHLVAALTDVNTDVDQFTDTEGLMGGYTWDHSSVTTSTAASSTVINYAVTVGQGYQYGTNGVYGNVFYLQNTTDDGTGNPVEATASASPAIELTAGYTYVFDVSHSSNSGHPLAFTTDGGSNPVTAGVTSDGTPGTAGATVTYIVPSPRPLNLQYYCTVHGTGMGNVITVRSDAYVAPATAPSYTLAWGGDRGITAGRDSAIIDTFTVSTPGNSSTNFGTLTSSSRYRYFSLSNANKTVFTGSENSGRMEYIVNATGGNAENLGSLQVARKRGGGSSDGTHGLFIGGEGYSNRIDRITVETAGDSTLFGTLYSAEYGNVTGNSTYAINWGGFNFWQMQYITYATGGTATQWATASTTAGWGIGTVSNETYGVTRSGTNMEYCTFDTLGSVATFGSLTENLIESYGGASNGITGVFVGQTATVGGDMKYITIDTQGDATDFGDVTRDTQPATTAGNLA
jgi:hypothetical protein